MIYPQWENIPYRAFLDIRENLSTLVATKYDSARALKSSLFHYALASILGIHYYPCTLRGTLSIFLVY